jgi:urease accessory protein
MATLSGHLELKAVARADGRTVIGSQSFRAPYHLSKPYWDADAGALLVQVVNPTAGILEGDSLASDISVESGAALLVTTPSANRLFKMNGGAAECRQHFTVGKGAWLEMMPEPLVPHRGSRYRQRTRIDVEAGGVLFFVDLLLPGRVAHGEAWEWERLQLETEIRWDGELVLRERFDQSGAEMKALAMTSGFGERACFGNAVLIAENDGRDVAWKTAVTAFHNRDCWVGVSALRRGGWSLKIVAAEGMKLRETLRAVRRELLVRFPRLACDPRKL